MGTSAAMTATTSFGTGAAIGGGTGFSAGFTTGLGNGISGQNFGQALWSGTKHGLIGGVSGAILGGITSGIDAIKNGKDFWNGEKIDVFKSPVSNNFGNQNGECVLRCFEEFSDSYGLKQYDYNYWFKQNNYKLGVDAKDIDKLIKGSRVFSSESIMPDAKSIANAFSNDKRVMMGFINSDNTAAHAVMVNKVKIWASGRFKFWITETSQVRIAPFAVTNIFKISGARFWSFYPL